MQLQATAAASPLPSRFQWSRQSLARVCAGLAGLLGAVVLYGWVFDVALLKSVLPGAVEMKANTAIGLILSAGALFFLADPKETARRSAGQALGLAVLALGLFTGAQYLFAWNFGIDELLFRDTGSAYNLIRGRMSPYTAAAFCVLGLALLALPRPALRLSVRVGATAVAAIGAMSFVGYLWNASELVTDRLLPPVAVHTAVAFMLLGAGALLAQRAENRRALSRKVLTRVEAKILAGFIAALLLLLLGGGYTYRASVQYADAMQEIARAQHVRAALSTLYATITDAGVAHGNYLITGDLKQRETFARRMVEADRQEERIQGLLLGGTQHRTNIAELRRLTDVRDRALAAAMDVYDREGFAAARARLVSGEVSATMQAIRVVFERIDAEEAAALELAQAHSTAGRRLTLVSLLLTCAIATGVLLFLFSAIRREMLGRHEGESFDATHRRVLLLFATSASREHSLRGLLQMLAADHGYVGCAFDSIDLSTGVLDREAKYGSLPESIASAEAKGSKVSAREAKVYVLANPVAYRGQHFGVLTIASRRGFSVRGRTFVAQMAAQLGVALDNAQQYEDVRQLAEQLRSGNEEIKQKNSQLEQASRMKSDFLATMSHELRTPLNAIIGFADVLRDGLLGELTELQRDHVGDILDSGEHLLALINDILDLSKVEAGRMTLDLEPVELRPLLQNAMSMVKEKALSQELHLTLEADDDLPRLLADPRKVKQILYNLLANAVKFTPDGGAVTLAARRVMGSGNELLELSVTDTGLGIAQEDQARLFQPFVQVDSSLARNYGGTGLGLAMVKRLAELHGGDVTLASEPGKGSTFTVSLPYRPVVCTVEEAEHTTACQPEFQETPAEPSTAPEKVAVAARGATVLVVDDDEMSIEIISAFLEGAGFTPIRASSGREAIEKARALQPDLIVLDLMMPDISGFEVVQAVKADAGTHAIPIIALTSKVFTAEDAQALHSRVDGVLHKDTFDNTAFIAEVRRALAEAAKAPAAYA